MLCQKTLICGFNSITFAARYLVVMEFALNRKQWLMILLKQIFSEDLVGVLVLMGDRSSCRVKAWKSFFCDSRRHCPFCHENFGGSASDDVLLA